MQALLARLGPDPLKPRADPQPAWMRLSRSRTAIGALLMDQAVMAGVGNVYRAEVLYRAGLSPFRMGRDVSAAEFAALWADLVQLMRLGVRDGRIVTTLPAGPPARQPAPPDPRGRALRLPAHRRALPALRHPDPDRADGRPAIFTGARNCQL